MRVAVAAWFAPLVLSALAACGPGGDTPRSGDAPANLAPLPTIDGYASAVGRQPLPWTRRTLADDFIELMFDTEWGVRNDRLLKWDRPVRIALIGAELEAHRAYAADLTRRLDAATGRALAVSLSPDADGEITFRAAPRRAMTLYAPGALCFFAPHQGDWRSFIKAQRAGRATWSGVNAFDHITVFIPEGSAPHEIRACLEEETAQALGPGNDLFRLEDSIFNDDAAHQRLTTFDAVMLRVLYDPALRSGMSRETAREAARAALGRLIPAFGEARRRPGGGADPYDVLRAKTLKSRSRSTRRRLATQLIRETESRAPRDHRLAEAYSLRAVLAFRDNEPNPAIADLERAEAVLEALGPSENVRLAITRSSLAAMLKREARARDALAVLAKAIPVLAAHAHDKHLAQALRWRAASLAQLGDTEAARPAAEYALAWGAYAYGPRSEEVAKWRREFREIGAAG